MSLDIFTLTCAELAALLKTRYGKGQYHAVAVYREIFKLGNVDFSSAAEFTRSADLGKRLAADVRLPSCRIVSRQQAKGVEKFATGLADGNIIESVIIPAEGRTTLCVSSQVGCRMGCRFCVTGSMGLKRNLNAEEIIWQVYAARFLLKRTVDNVVFMGMGEPLDNLDNVLKAIRVMNDQRGLDIPPSHITVSTAGLVPGIRALSQAHMPKLNLAVSLNAANDELRSRLMPINHAYPLAELKAELATYPLARKGIIFIEYVLISGVNDMQAHALELAQYLAGLQVRVNVIAYNGGAAAVYQTPSQEEVSRFCGWLAEAKVFVRARASRGQGIMAACGQLGASLAPNTWPN